MRHAVVFSSFIPDTEVARFVGAYYVDLFQRRFADSTIYVGINAGSSQDWRAALSASGLDVVLCETPAHLVVDSDVSGFQSALRTIRNTGARHDFYWFGHTKGATHDAIRHTDGLREVLERDFWSRRDEVEQRCDPARHGAFLAYPMLTTTRSEEIVDYLRGVFPALYPPVGAFPTYTFFGMTGVSLRNFLAGAEDRFFSQNLIAGTGLSRYFFEGGFAWVADMGGFEPYLLEKGPLLSADDPALRAPCRDIEFIANQQRAAKVIEAWKADKAGHDFAGWPLWAGERIAYRGHVYEADEFFRLHPGHAP